MADKENDKIKRVTYSVALEQQEKREKKSVLISLLTMLVSVCLILFTLIPLMRYDTTPIVEKATIQNRLTSIIKSGAPLDVVKHAYEVRHRQDPPLFSKVDMNDYYTENTPLSGILSDLLVNYYSAKENEKDSTFLFNLNSIIQENQYHNPFDNLEDFQSRYFENLRFKIGDGYDVVEDDVIQIATELDHKNQLVSRYLNKSNTSFKISIIALIVTCLLSLFQIYQGNRTNKKLKELEQQQLTEDSN